MDECIKSHQPVPPDSWIPIRSEATNQRRGSDRAPTSESQQGSDNGLTFYLGNRDPLEGSSADRPFLSIDKDYPKANKARNGEQRVPVLSQNVLSTMGALPGLELLPAPVSLFDKASHYSA